MSKKSKNLNVIGVFCFIISITLVISFIYVYFSILNNPNETIIIENASINDSEKVVGYITRCENIIENTENKAIKKIKSDGQKCCKDESVYKFVNENTKDLDNEIKEIDKQINEILINNNYIISNSSIDKQIEDIIYDLNDINHIEKIEEKKSKLEELFFKRLELYDINSEDTKLLELVNKRKQIEKQIDSNSEIVTSPSAGIVCYNIDGYEQILPSSNINNYNLEYLEQLDIPYGIISKNASNSTKIISSFDNYLIVFSNSQNAKNAKKGKKVTLKFFDGTRINSRIYSIEDDGDYKKIVFALDSGYENLAKYRKVNLSIIWWEANGLKVPNSSLLLENNLYYIIRIRNGYNAKILVNVIKQNETDSIIDNYSVDKLYELGFSQKEIINSRKISIYDEVLVNSQNYK